LLGQQLGLIGYLAIVLVTATSAGAVRSTRSHPGANGHGEARKRSLNATDRADEPPH
jgi:hypothetical protein